MCATFISPNKFIMIVFSTIYLMILIMCYKCYYSFIYNWSKFKKVDFSGSENDFYFGTEGVMFYYPNSKSISTKELQKGVLSLAIGHCKIMTFA
jgi:hypothetical protein